MLCIVYLLYYVNKHQEKYSKSGVFPMPAFTKSTSFQTLETFQSMYITKQIPWQRFILIGMCVGIQI